MKNFVWVFMRQKHILKVCFEISPSLTGGVIFLTLNIVNQASNKLPVYPGFAQGFQPSPIGYGGHDAGQAAFGYVRLTKEHT